PTFWMLNGAKPAGMRLSVKAPLASATGAKFLSKTSTWPLWKSVANRKLLAPSLAMATPLKTASGTSTASWAWDDGAGLGTFGFQAVIVPSSETKMKKAGALSPFAAWMTKSLVPLNTWPVGAPRPLTSGGAGFWMNGDPFTPPRNSDAMPVPLSETQRVPPFGPSAIPHGLTRFGSVIWATPG